MIYSYLRVSTSEQSYDYQKTQALHYANELNLGTVTFVEDVVSGAKDWRKRAIGELVNNTMNKGDILLVNEFSRLGRSLLDILEILKVLKEKECQVHIVREKMIIGDDMSSKMMVFMFSLVSEIERDLIKSRVKEGVANSRAKNPTKTWGRKKGSMYKSKLDDKREYIIELLEKRISKASIAKMLGVNYQTLVSYIKTRELLKEVA